MSLCFSPVAAVMMQGRDGRWNVEFPSRDSVELTRLSAEGGDSGGNGDFGYDSDGTCDDGFWTGRLRDELATAVEPGKAVVRRGGLVGGEYRDPDLKTFAYWYTACVQDLRTRPSVPSGNVQEEWCSDDGSSVCGVDGDRLGGVGGSWTPRSEALFWSALGG